MDVSNSLVKGVECELGGIAVETKNEKPTLDLASLVVLSELQNRAPLPTGLQLETSLHDAVTISMQDRFGFDKKGRGVDQIKPSKPSESLNPGIRQRLQGLLDVLSSKAFFYETGHLINAIHLYADGLFQDAVKDGLLDEKVIDVLHSIKYICCLVGVSQTKGDFDGPLLEACSNTFLPNAIKTLTGILNAIPHNPKIQKLQPKTKATIIAKRQSLLSPLLETLRLVQDLAITKPGLQVLGQNCEDMVPANERGVFSLADLFATIQQRYQILLADFHAVTSDRVMRLPGTVYDREDKKVFVTFCKEMQRSLEDCQREFQACIKGKYSAGNLFGLYSKLSTVTRAFQTRKLPGDCDALLTGFMAVSNTFWGLEACVLQACYGASIEVDKRRLSMEEITQIEQCIIGCEDLAVFNELLNWSRLDELFLQFEAEGVDRDVAAKTARMIEVFKEQAQYLTDVWLGGPPETRIRVDVLKKSLNGTIDPRDLYYCRTMYVNEVDRIAIKAVEKITPEVLDTLNALANLTDFSMVRHRLVMFVRVLLGGLDGVHKEIWAVRDIFRIGDQWTSGGETESDEIIIKEVVKNPRKKKGATKGRNKSGKQITSKKNVETPPPKNNENTKALSVESLNPSGSLFESEGDLDSFICGMINQPVEVQNEEQPVIVEDVTAIVMEEIVIEEVIADEELKAPPKPVSKVVPPAKVKKKSKERIDYSGKACSLRRVIDRLKQHNYHLVRHTGGHAQLKNYETGDHVTLSDHGKEISKRALRDLETRFAVLKKK